MDCTYLFLAFVVIGIPAVFLMGGVGHRLLQGRNAERKV